MKKLLVVSMVTLFMVNLVGAQESKSDNRNAVQFGLKAGINRSNMYDSKTQDFSADAKFGFAGGAFLTLPIGKIIGIQPEVLYSQKGFKGSGILLGQSYNFTRTTNYVDIPLFLAIKPISAVTILAGPQFSYLLSQQDNFVTTAYSNNQQKEFNNDNLRKNILCFVGGLDFNVNPVIIGARVGWDVQNNNGDGTSNTPRYKNAWLQLTLGVRL